MTILNIIDNFYKDYRNKEHNRKLGALEKVAIKEALEWVVENYDIVPRSQEGTNEKTKS